MWTRNAVAVFLLAQTRAGEKSGPMSRALIKGGGRGVHAFCSRRRYGQGRSEPADGQVFLSTFVLICVPFSLAGQHLHFRRHFTSWCYTCADFSAEEPQALCFQPCCTLRVLHPCPTRRYGRVWVSFPLVTYPPSLTAANPSRVRVSQRGKPARGIGSHSLCVVLPQLPQ
jgi:hypothetical protein